MVDNAVRHGILPKPRPVDVDGDGHVGPDEPKIAIRASAHADRVELRVVDHGQRLPKGKADTAAFAPFQRLGDRNTTNGIGLGLFVAKGFVDAMDGTLRAEDTPGAGSPWSCPSPRPVPANSSRRERPCDHASWSRVSRNCHEIPGPAFLLLNIQPRRIFSVSSHNEVPTIREPNCREPRHRDGRRWRRANASTPNNECVEVARTSEAVVVRDSKAATLAVLWFGASVWDTFLDHVRAR